MGGKEKKLTESERNVNVADKHEVGSIGSF